MKLVGLSSDIDGWNSTKSRAVVAPNASIDGLAVHPIARERELAPAECDRRCMLAINSSLSSKRREIQNTTTSPACQAPHRCSRRIYRTSWGQPSILVVCIAMPAMVLVYPKQPPISDTFLVCVRRKLSLL